MTQEEIEAIVLAEYGYWRNAPESVSLQAMGAMGAAANIYCAIQGHRAPWHPKEKLPDPQPPEQAEPCGLCNGSKVYWKNTPDGQVETACPYCDPTPTRNPLKNETSIPGA